MRKLLKDFEIGDRIVGWVSGCYVCGVLFVSRQDALFCSNACQMVAYRRRLVGLEPHVSAQVSGTFVFRAGPMDFLDFILAVFYRGVGRHRFPVQTASVPALARKELRKQRPLGSAEEPQPGNNWLPGEALFKRSCLGWSIGLFHTACPGMKAG